MRRLPDFLIGGAPRSATTWLCAMLDRHPAVHLVKPYNPEVKFFSRDDIHAKGLDFYATLFSGVPEGKTRVGEKTSGYLENPFCAGRIHAAVPGVKMLFILRNPVERAYSNYLWSVHNGLESESFEDALAAEEERERNYGEKWRRIRPWSYFSRGLYARHLAPYFALFPRERILCLRHEDIGVKPNEALAEAFSFLGVHALDLGTRGAEIINAVPGNAEKQPMPRHVRSMLAERYARPNAELEELLRRRMEWE